MTSSTVPTHDGWIQTYSGTPFDLLEPSAAQVSAQDIAVALSRQPRFSGHTTRHFSVVCCAVVLEQRGYRPAIVLQALLHDATEAYVVDVPRPLKALLPAYRVIEDKVWTAIADHFGVAREMHPAVKWVDEEMLSHEANALLPGGAQGWSAAAPEGPPPAMLARSVMMTMEQSRAAYLSRLEYLVQAQLREGA